MKKTVALRKNFLLLVALVLIASCKSVGQPTEHYSPEIEKTIAQVEQNPGVRIQVQGQARKTLQERMAFYHVNGLSIAVVHNYRLEWARGYGWADSAENRLFYVNSVL
jgi:hypothetical protein